MHIISNIALITINETLFIQLISFLIFLFLINRIMFKPLQETIQQREEHINGIASGIESSKNQLLEMDSNLKIRESAVIKEADKHKNKLEEDGTRFAKEILDESRKEILGIKEENRQYIEGQISKARKEIKEESEKLAVHIMEKVLDRRLAQ
ncbi:MAG: ATP synthase F0 subunit B [Desulfobacteraceae bacterium]|nr:ATP synthase F0 subunit B [Desulfobacteraceae bacterium]MBC2754292.1 ATP synthase F0 subunit B [Desulfobacteraceae bacterium]